MSESEELYQDEIIVRDDVLNVAISLNEETEAIFAVRLDDGGDVYELEYTRLHNIKTMLIDCNYIFIKRTKI